MVVAWRGVDLTMVASGGDPPANAPDDGLDPWTELPLSVLVNELPFQADSFPSSGQLPGRVMIA